MSVSVTSIVNNYAFEENESANCFHSSNSIGINKHKLECHDLQLLERLQTQLSLDKTDAFFYLDLSINFTSKA